MTTKTQDYSKQRYYDYVDGMLDEGLTPAPYAVWLEIETTMDEEAGR